MMLATFTDSQYADEAAYESLAASACPPALLNRIQALADIICLEVETKLPHPNRHLYPEMERLLHCRSWVDLVQLCKQEVRS